MLQLAHASKLGWAVERDTCLSALTTESDVNLHGSGANLVAMKGRSPVSLMAAPRISSLRPNPYTCQACCVMTPQLSGSYKGAWMLYLSCVHERQPLLSESPVSLCIVVSGIAIIVAPVPAHKTKTTYAPTSELGSVGERQCMHASP